MALVCIEENECENVSFSQLKRAIEFIVDLLPDLNQKDEKKFVFCPAHCTPVSISVCLACWEKGLIFVPYQSYNLELLSNEVEIEFMFLENEINSEEIFNRIGDRNKKLKIRNQIAYLSSVEAIIQSGIGLNTNEKDLFYFSNFSFPRYIYLLQSSGSTSTPKLIIGTGIGFTNRLNWLRASPFKICSDDIGCCFTNFSFVDCFAVVFDCICNLRPCALINVKILNKNQLQSKIIKSKITRLTAVPSLLEFIFKDVDQNNFSMRNLKLICSSGEPLSSKLAKKISDFGIKVLNLFGCTEASGDSSFFCVNKGVVLTELFSPIGTCIAGHSFLIKLHDGTIVDPMLQFFKDDLLGELIIQGVGISESVCANGEDCFATGDIVKFETKSKLFYWIERTNFVFKRFGCKISLSELEYFIINSDLHIAEAVCVFAYNSLVIFLSLVGDVPHRIGESYIPVDIEFDVLLRKLIRSNFPWYYYPTEVYFVVDPTSISKSSLLPTTFSGKKNRQYLLKWWVQNSNMLHMDESLKNISLKDFVSRCFQLVFNKSCFDNFFDNGGDSIIAVSLALKLSQGLSIEISAYDILLHSTIHDLVAFIESEKYIPIKIPSNPTISVESISECTLIEIPKMFDSNCFALCKAGWQFQLHDYFPTDSNFVSEFQDIRISFELPSCISPVNNKKKMILKPNYVNNSISRLKLIMEIDLIKCVDATPLVVTSRDEVFAFVGSHAGLLVCIDIKHKKEIWCCQLPHRIEGSCSIGKNRRLFVGCYDSRIYVIDALCGNILGTFGPSIVTESLNPIKCQPCVITVGNSEVVVYGDYSSKILFVPAESFTSVCKTNKKSRKYENSQTIDVAGSVFASPVWIPSLKLLLICTLKGCIYCFKLESLGRIVVKWQISMGPVFATPLVIDSQILLCDIEGCIKLISVENREETWCVRDKDWVFGFTPLIVYAEEKLLVVPTKTQMLVFNFKSGSKLFSIDSIDGTKFCSSPCSQFLMSTHNNVSCNITFCTSGGNICVGKLSAVKFEMLSIYDVNADIFSSPVFVNDKIIIGTRSNKLLVLEQNS